MSSVVTTVHSAWLPVKQRIDFTLVVLVYTCTSKSLHGLPLPYLLDGCQLVTDVGLQHLRSSDVYMCIVPRTQSQIGDRSFSVAGPRLWNNLPTEIRRRDIIFEHHRRSFRLRCIVTFTFKSAGHKHSYALTHCGA